MPNNLDSFSQKSLSSKIQNQVPRFLHFIFFLFFLFSFFKINTINIHARCASINGGCYSFSNCGTVSDTCGGGGTCTYYNGADAGATCNLPTKDATGLSALACGLEQAALGGTCTPEYNYGCGYLDNSPSGPSYTTSNCNNTCNGSAGFSCKKYNSIGTYTFHVDSHEMWVQDMCTPRCPAGYTNVGQASGTCTVTCGACCNSTNCVKNPPITSQFYLCNSTTHDCGYDSYTDINACEAVNGVGNCYTNLDTCNLDCALPNQNYYSCNSGSCDFAGSFSSSTNCSAANSGATCYTSSDCDNKCTKVPMYYCSDKSTNSCNSTSSTYTNDQDGKDLCNFNLDYYNITNFGGCYFVSGNCDANCQDKITMYYCNSSNTCTASAEQYDNTSTGINNCSFDKGTLCHTDSNCDGTCTSSPPTGSCTCPSGSVSTCPSGYTSSTTINDSCGQPLCHTCAPTTSWGCSGIDGGKYCIGESCGYVEIPYSFTPHNGTPGQCSIPWATIVSTIPQATDNLCTWPSQLYNFRQVDSSHYMWNCTPTPPSCTSAIEVSFFGSTIHIGDNVSDALSNCSVNGEAWCKSNGSSAAGCADSLPSCKGMPSYAGNCMVITNQPPIIDSLVIKNNLGGIVYSDNSEVGTSKNQICDNTTNRNFNGSRLVTFEVTAHDLDASDTLDIKLSWKGNQITRLTSTKTGTSTLATFQYDTTGINESSIYPLVVSVTDGKSPITASPRNLKIWDCGVYVIGTIYDGTDGIACPNTGYNTPADPPVLVFSSLIYNGNDGQNFNMTVNSSNSTYNSGDKLVWGKTYSHIFNEDISLSNEQIRFRKSSADAWICSNGVDSSVADPYASSPSFIADFSGILIQDPWWRANGGGVISNNEVSDQIPITCQDNCKISVNGLVSAPFVRNQTNKSISDAQTWIFGNTSGDPNNNAKLVNVNTNYNYFYNQYFVKKNIGAVLSGDKTISRIDDLGSDPNGVYFINGNLTISGDIVNSNNFLMIIVSGNVEVKPDAKRVDGILIANNILTSGISDNQLVFNGSLFALGNIDFSREYLTKVKNNKNPTVAVNYDPKLMFNMPNEITKVLVNWQWGN